MKYTTELISRGVLAWLDKRPFSRETRARRKAERKALRAGRELTSEQIETETIEETPMQLDFGTRTSTNALVGGGLFSQIYVQLVTLIPGEGAIELLLLKPETVAFAAVLFATLVARVSKTPAQPGKL